MDQKQINQLNPKLKEVYERVMGAATHKPSGVPTKSPMSKPLKSTPPPEPQSPTNPTSTITTPFTTQESTLKPFQPQQIVDNKKHQSLAKKKNKMTPVFIAIGVLIFFVLYTLIWIKVFNLKIPFLPF